MPVARALPAPIAYLDFCARSPAECSLNSDERVGPATRQGLYQRYWGGVFEARGQRTGQATIDQGGGVSPARVALDAALWRLMSDTNLRVNATVHDATDQALYGQANVWALPTRRGAGDFGNCKDVALEKRHDLLAAGLPPASLAIALVRTPGGRSHAVLTVATDHGDFVLDSLTPWVSPWKDLNYVWVERQDPQDPTRWLALDAAPSQVGQQAQAGEEPNPRLGS